MMSIGASSNVVCVNLQLAPSCFSKLFLQIPDKWNLSFVDGGTLVYASTMIPRTSPKATSVDKFTLALLFRIHIYIICLAVQILKYKIYYYDLKFERE